LNRPLPFGVVEDDSVFAILFYGENMAEYRRKYGGDSVKTFRNG